MKLSNELRVGILAFVSISLLIWGYAYLKGNNILTTTIQVYATYDSVTGLQKAGPVKVNGFKVGAIGDIYLKEDFSGKIIVRFDLNKNLELPKKGTYAVVSADVMGNGAVALKFDKKCTDNCLETGDTIKGVNFGALNDITENIDPYMNWAQSSFDALDSMLTVYTYDRDNPTYKALVDLRDNLIKVNQGSKKFDGTLGISDVKIDKILKSIKTQTKGYNDDSEKMVTTMADAAKSIKDIKKLDLNTTIGNTADDLEKARQKTADINKSVKKITTSTKKINKGEGSIGKLINTNNMYDSLKIEIDRLKKTADSIRIKGN